LAAGTYRWLAWPYSHRSNRQQAVAAEQPFSCSECAISCRRTNDPTPWGTTPPRMAHLWRTLSKPCHPLPENLDSHTIVCRAREKNESCFTYDKIGVQSLYITEHVPSIAHLGSIMNGQEFCPTKIGRESSYVE
jgi:hypothetical protein